MLKISRNTSKNDLFLLGSSFMIKAHCFTITFFTRILPVVYTESLTLLIYFYTDTFTNFDLFTTLSPDTSLVDLSKSLQTVLLVWSKFLKRILKKYSHCKTHTPEAIVC